MAKARADVVGLLNDPPHCDKGGSFTRSEQPVPLACIGPAANSPAHDARRSPCAAKQGFAVPRSRPSEPLNNKLLWLPDVMRQVPHGCAGVKPVDSGGVEAVPCVRGDDVKAALENESFQSLLQLIPTALTAYVTGLLAGPEDLMMMPFICSCRNKIYVAHLQPGGGGGITVSCEASLGADLVVCKCIPVCEQSFAGHCTFARHYRYWTGDNRD